MKKKNKRLEKRACERYQSLSRENKDKNRRYGRKDIKIYQELKSKNWVSIEKNISKWEKTLSYDYKKSFFFLKIKKVPLFSLYSSMD